MSEEPVAAVLREIDRRHGRAYAVRGTYRAAVNSVRQSEWVDRRLAAASRALADVATLGIRVGAL